MGGRDCVEAVVRGYFDYTVEHEEVFSFVEQCSRCPTLSEQVSEEECGCEVLDLFHAAQDRGEMRRCSDAVLAAVLFPPVRFLASNRCKSPDGMGEELGELVRLLQDLLCL